jgi:signal transduction histidine kinase
VFDDFDYSRSLIHKIIELVVASSYIIFISRFFQLKINEIFVWKRESEKKINTIRSKIAYEMHQDIGNDLNALLFKIKNWQFKNGNIQNVEYQQLEKSTIKVIGKVNDIVWSLDAEKNNLHSLQNYLIRYAEDTLSNSNLQYSIEQVELIPKRKLDLITKKNIYLLFKEVINNIVKHAEASHVKIQIKYQSRKLSVCIADNGKGFDLNKINKGNGLDSMNQRINQLNGKIEILPNLPKGSLVKFELKV